MSTESVINVKLTDQVWGFCKLELLHAANNTVLIWAHHGGWVSLDQSGREEAEGGGDDEEDGVNKVVTLFSSTLSGETRGSSSECLVDEDIEDEEGEEGDETEKNWCDCWQLMDHSH